MTFFGQRTWPHMQSLRNNLTFDFTSVKNLECKNYLFTVHCNLGLKIQHCPLNSPKGRSIVSDLSVTFKLHPLFPPCNKYFPQSSPNISFPPSPLPYHWMFNKFNITPNPTVFAALGRFNIYLFTNLRLKRK